MRKNIALMAAALVTFAALGCSATPSIAQSVSIDRPSDGNEGGGPNCGGGGDHHDTTTTSEDPGTPETPTTTVTPVTPGTPDSPRPVLTDGGDSEMLTPGCGSYGWANMPSYCMAEVAGCGCSSGGGSTRTSESCDRVNPKLLQAVRNQCAPRSHLFGIF